MRKKFNKSRRPNNQKVAKSNNKRSTKEESKDTMKEYESNAAEWYTGDTALTFDAGRFNWYYPNGTLIQNVFKSRFAYSGVLSMYLNPSVGVSLDGTSAVNVAARKLYTWIRRSKSNYNTYNPSDLMQYCIAMSQAYQFHNWMCRIYGIMNVYSQVNRYIPDSLLDANLVDSKDLRANMSDFLFYINKFGSQISSLAAPATLPYFKRQAWLYSSVYTDDQSGKSTLFMYCPAGFYYYDEANAQLVWQALPNTPSTYSKFADIITLGDKIVNSILNSEDFWNISADILNAYDNDVLNVSALPVDYTVVPTFDLEVLSQIQNTWITGNISVTQHANDITQDANGQLVYNPRIPLGSTTAADIIDLYNAKSVVVNMYKDDVRPEDVFVATRMLPSFYVDGTTAYMSSVGSEFCSTARIYYFTPGSNGVIDTSYNTFNRIVNFGNGSVDITLNNSNLGLISRLSQISYHPHVYALSLMNDGSANPVIANCLDVGDISNFTVMSPTDLSKLHMASLFSLFNVPTLGGFKG